MNNTNNEIKYTYGIYARKSSESEDRQVQSIERQIDDFMDIIDKEHLNVYGNPLQESKSAFSVGREQFNTLVTLTRQGQVNAWLCWHANRLSRNPIDAGVIIDLLDKGLLNHIRTPSRIYYNTPTDKMMLQIEFTMSKKDSDDKSVFVKSGLKKRYKKGLPNGKAPIGYLNDKTKEKGDRDWLVDKERFKKLKRLFNRFLKGKDSLNTITAYARDVLELTTPKTKRQGGKLVGRSSVEHILKNPIYAGFFYSKDEFGNNRTLRKLNPSVPRIIQEEEHMKILNIFGDRYYPNQQKHTTPYSGFIFGKDGNYMGADVKLQVICDCLKKFAYRNKDTCPNCGVKITEMQSPKYLSYTYYYNIKRKKTKGLSAKSIEQGKIEQALTKLFENEIRITKEMYDWSKRHLNLLKDKQLEESKKQAIEHQEKIKALEGKKERLRELFMDNMISKEEYREDIRKLEKRYISEKDIKSYHENWYEHLNEHLDLLYNLGRIFKEGDYLEKKYALELLGPNLVWDEENLLILKADWVKAYVKGRKKILSLFPEFEPKNKVENKGLNGVLDVVCPTMLCILDNIRKLICFK